VRGSDNVALAQKGIRDAKYSNYASKENPMPRYLCLLALAATAALLGNAALAEEPKIIKPTHPCLAHPTDACRLPNTLALTGGVRY
jgi:hypothetical protein